MEPLEIVAGPQAQGRLDVWLAGQCADLSLSRSTVKRAIKDLEKAALIRKEPHYRENGSAISNRYYLL